jgi:hydrophobe/amphiphile efflux-3 (HAE3) family protein
MFWRRAGITLGKRWLVVVVVVAAVTAVLLAGLSRLEFATGQDSYLNPGSQAAIDNVAFQDQFGGETMILLFMADEGRDIRDLYNDTNRAELERLETELRAIEEQYAVITPLTSLGFSSRIVDEGVGTNALTAALSNERTTEADREARGGDIGITLGRLGQAGDADLARPEWVEFLLFDNTGFGPDAGNAEDVLPAADVRQIRPSLRSTFPDQQTAVGGVLLEPNADLDTLSAGTEKALEIMATAELDGFEVVTTGSPVFLKDINDYLKGGMLTLGAIAIAVMAIILLVAFRVRWRLLPLLAVLVAVLWSFSILGFIGVDLSLVTISGLPILIGLGIDYAIQVHNRVEEESALEQEVHPMAETLANVGPPLVVATIGGVLAFLVLRVSRVPMIRDFGVMLAVGIVVILVTGIVIPTAALGIREWKSKTADRPDSLVERAVVKLGSLPQQFVIPLILGAVGLLIAGVAMEGQFKIESDPVRWINQDSQTVADIDLLSERTGFASTLGILVEANNVNEDDVSELLWGFVADAEARDEVIVSSSTVTTISKVINFDGVTAVPPRGVDLEAAVAVMPPDIRRALVNTEGTATQVNLRLAAASLDERRVLVRELEDDLANRIEALELPADSILLTDLADGQQPVRAVPAGLAVVGVGLLENLTANRAVLTYLAVAVAALWLAIRFGSIIRMLVALVPVLLAVGASSVIVGVLGLSLSPLTTVSGPLVVATCTEFAVLILGRYLEERQRGLDSQAASDKASARTGRAFFTSALTTIGGFAVLVGSALPLLRDFGIIVTLNVAIALLSALVLMPPLLVWADNRGWLTGDAESEAANLARKEAGASHGDAPYGGAGSVRLLGRPSGPLGVVSMLAIPLLLAVVVVMFASTSSDEAEALDDTYQAIALTTTTTEAPPPTAPEPEVIDPTTFPAEAPNDPNNLVVGPTLYGFLVDAGADPQQARCTADVLESRVPAAELIDSGLTTFTDEVLEPVKEAATDCQVPPDIYDAAVAIARGG